MNPSTSTAAPPAPPATSFDDVEPVFVVGFPRSGTTLLQVMLDAHPRLALLTEVHYFSEILQIKSTVPSLRAGDDFAQFLTLVRKCGHFRRLINGEELVQAVQERLRERSERTYELFYRCLLEENARLKGVARFGEKTPPNVRYLEELIAIFPRARIIHIVRDPRAAIASIQQMPWYPREVVTSALKWYLDVRAARQFAERHPENLYQVRYEDLVTEPSRELEAMCQFIGEEFDARMLQYHKGSDQVVSFKHEPWSTGIAKPLYQGRLTSWEGELSASEIYVIDRITGRLREEAGYPALPRTKAARWLAPGVVATALIRYVPFKIRQTKLARRGPGETGETKRLYRMLAGLLTKRSQ